MTLPNRSLLVLGFPVLSSEFAEEDCFNIPFVGSCAMVEVLASSGVSALTVVLVVASRSIMEILGSFSIALARANNSLVVGSLAFALLADGVKGEANGTFMISVLFL